MSKKSTVLLPETIEILEQMGLQIKYARLRKNVMNGERFWRMEPAFRECE